VAHDETLPVQNRAMRDYANRRGWTIVMQVREVASVRRDGKPAKSCWRPHVAGRSMSPGVAAGPLGPVRNRSAAILQELEHLGVGFVSLSEALDLTTPAGRGKAGLLAIFAEFERGS
jgi:hypothetical protein